MNSTVTVNGAQIAYRFDGPANGRVVLMSNSLMSNYDMWDRTVPALSDRYRVLRYDTRGHGRSSTPPGPYSIAMLADDAAGLLDALGIAAVHFAGLSMGGMVGQQLAARYPDKVHSLALCDTASEMPPREMWEQRLAAARSQGVPGLADSTLQRWFTEPFLRRAPGEVEKVLRQVRAALRPGGRFLGIVPAIDAVHYHTMLLVDRAREFGMPEAKAWQNAASHGEHELYDFARGGFRYAGLEQHFWQPFEIRGQFGPRRIPLAIGMAA